MNFANYDRLGSINRLYILVLKHGWEIGYCEEVDGIYRIMLTQDDYAQMIFLAPADHHVCK